MNEVLVYNEQNHWRKIQYEVIGKYWPATMWEPAEYPDLFMHSVIGCDDEGNEFETELSDDEYDYLESQVWKAINSQAGGNND